MQVLLLLFRVRRDVRAQNVYGRVHQTGDDFSRVPLAGYGFLLYFCIRLSEALVVQWIERKFPKL